MTKDTDMNRLSATQYSLLMEGFSAGLLQEGSLRGFSTRFLHGDLTEIRNENCGGFSARTRILLWKIPHYAQYSFVKMTLAQRVPMRFPSEGSLQQMRGKETR